MSSSQLQCTMKLKMTNIPLKCASFFAKPLFIFFSHKFLPLIGDIFHRLLMTDFLCVSVQARKLQLTEEGGSNTDDSLA